MIVYNKSLGVILVTGDTQMKTIFGAERVGRVNFSDRSGGERSRASGEKHLPRQLTNPQ